jgi:Rieske 2Fe-2S family protein
VLEKSLNRAAYVDSDNWDIEKHKVFASNWFCIGRHDEVGSTSGSYKLVDLQGEQVLVVRGADNSLRAFVNMCRHRGTELVDSTDTSASVGCFGALIRCPYHNWTYNTDGSLRGAPHLVDIDYESSGLLQLGLEVWGGFVFIRQHDGEESLLDSIGEISTRVSNYPLSELVIGRTITYEVAANWKVLEENYNECYHCGPVHPELCDLVPSFRAGGASDLNWDNGVAHREGAYTFTSSGTTSRKPFAGLSEAELVNHKGELVYPNLFLSMSCDHVAAFVLWPKGPAHTTIVCNFLFHPSEVAKPDFDPSDAADFWDVVNLQDWSICERVQRGMMSKFFTQGLFAPMETPSLDIREWWKKQMDKK